MAHPKDCRCAECTDAVGIDFSPSAWGDGDDRPLSKDDPDFYRQTGIPVGVWPKDMDRILALPRRQPIDPTSVTAQAIVELEQTRYARPNDACDCRKIDPNRFVDKAGKPRDGCLRRLLPAQAIMLREIRQVRGMLAQAAVGLGKTLIWLLTPMALEVPVSLLFIPASLVDQIEIDYKLLSQHFRVPSIIIHQTESKEWRKLVPGAPLLHVLPYSQISSPRMSAWIDNLEPDAIICDEIDAFSSLTSSRTIRLLRFFSGTPDMSRERRLKRAATICVGGTGSLTDKGIDEFGHLLAIILKYGSPVPLEPEALEDWGRCLNATDAPCPPGDLIRLCQDMPSDDDETQLERVYTAFHRRLVETPGFISIEGEPNISAAGTVVENVIRERPAPVIPPIILTALEYARDYRRPDSLAGAEEDEWLVDPLEQARVVRQVATGMFYRWCYPNKEPLALRTRWLLARKNWNRELRQKMIMGQVHLDSAGLCEAAARRAWGDSAPVRGLPDWKAEHWPAWRDVADLVQPEKEAVRLHKFLVEDAAKWALESPGIVWYGMIEFGEWLAELTKLPLHGGGPGAGKRLMAEKGNRSIIASIASHGRGRDRMQFAFNRQLIAQAMASDRRFQQLFGRLDRRGQAEPQVFTDIYLHVPEVRKSFDQALTRGRYVERTTAEKRKLAGGWRG